MDNSDVLALFSLIDKYCQSVNCDYCIIKDICECTYYEIGTPRSWTDIIKKRIKNNEWQKKLKRENKNG